MTSGFQNDPLGTRLGQHRQMIGEMFLVGLGEATSSEKIIKLKTFLKDDIDISNIMDSNVEHDENIKTLLHHVDLSRCPDEMVRLSEDNRDVEIYIAGYVAKKIVIVELKILIFVMFRFYQEELLELHQQIW